MWNIFYTKKLQKMRKYLYRREGKWYMKRFGNFENFRKNKSHKNIVTLCPQHSVTISMEYRHYRMEITSLYISSQN